MAVLKLQLDEFDAIDYDLIAIHSTVEDYRMAFLLNQQLPIILHKNKSTIEVSGKEGEASFAYFVYDDEKAETNWVLIPNKNEIVVRKKSTGQNLFLDAQVEIATRVYLLPELKKVDYFLKIEHQDTFHQVDQLLSDIKKINQVSTVYVVDPKKIKSKNNLIF
ncbi:MAG: IPExxxVDY family protein [Flavobacterium sp.]|jgi:hypothetical protein|nr:IPExxxVDY family protein [Flavobacterium sp.]